VTLRGRLALTLALTAPPLLAGFYLARREWTRRYDVQALRDLVATRVASLGRERCEAAPEDFLPPPPARGPGPPGRPARGPGAPPLREAGPPPERPDGPPSRPRGPGEPRPRPPRHAPVHAFVYDAAFRAADPAAPAFPSSLREALAAGSGAASRRLAIEGGRGEGLELALRTEWGEGRCAFVLARRFGPPSDSPPLSIGSALPPLLVLLASVLLAAGPTVRRIRALTAEVHRAAETRYAAPVRAAGSDEIAELARAFNQAGAKVREQIAALEERERTLRDFLANTTHDVMLPLTVLLGHLSGFRRRVLEGGRIEEAQLVPAIQEAQYLASLIHNLGAAAKLEAGEPLVERHAVELGALVERVVERHRPVAGPAGVGVEFGVPERPVVVEGDVTLVEQAVSNLVHNAVRYNRAGGHVAVLLDEEAPGFRLRVVDDGPGVPDEDLARLVERRRRGDAARQRHPHGLGLGLHIARGVAERHGFRLELRRSEHGGLEATLSGPLREPAPR
jgi:signal transduction histidine kinase